MPGLVTSHPFKALYALFGALKISLSFPLWLLIYIPRSFRPHPKWSYLQAVRVRVLRAVLYQMAVVEIRTPLSLRPGFRERNRFAVMKPVGEGMVRGILRDSEVKPQPVGGTWYPKPYQPSNSHEEVVLHFHGGAYVIGDGRTGDCGHVANCMLKGAKVSKVFCPQYRLSSNPGGRFPAQLQDAVTSYAYLLQLGIRGSSITVSGDSAGGNLALALLRYLEEYGDSIGLARPSCAWLWSPWVDVDAARDPNSITSSPHQKSDYLNGTFASWGARTFAPTNDPRFNIKSDNGYISPLRKPFKTSVPLWIQTGGAEVLQKDDIDLAKENQKIGNTVELHLEDGAVHDIILIGHIAGQSEQALQCAKRAGHFLRKNRKEF